MSLSQRGPAPDGMPWVGIPWVVQDPGDWTLGKVSSDGGGLGHPGETRKILEFYSTSRALCTSDFLNVVTNTQNKAYTFTDKMNM